MQSCGQTDGTVSTGVWAMAPSIPQESEAVGYTVRRLPRASAVKTASVSWRMERLAQKD